MMMSNKIDFLSKVSIFSLVEKTDLQRIAQLTHHHSFQQGETIIREGEHDRQLFILVSGEVEVIKNLGKKKQRRVAIMGPYSYFGEMALIDDLARSASVVAMEDTEVLSLNHWNLRQEIERYPALAFELLQMLSRRIRAIEKTIMSVLGTFVSICSCCRKIRTEDDTWIPLEQYIRDRYEAEFTHGICPQCMAEHYPQYAEKITSKRKQ
jgi:CRP-like cAMP-binding protein